MVPWVLLDPAWASLQPSLNRGGNLNKSCIITALVAAARFLVGIVTGTVSQNEADLRGAEALVRLYGSIKDGGIILHQTDPDDFMSQGGPGQPFPQHHLGAHPPEGRPARAEAMMPAVGPARPK